MYKVFDPKQTNQLFLLRNGWLDPNYELTDKTFNYGRLSYNWLSRRTAAAESAEHNWLFKLGFIFSRSITITDENGALIGETYRPFLSRTTTLTLQSGFRADFYRPYFLSREYVWEAEGYGIVLRMKSYPFLFKDDIYIEQSMTPPAFIPLLIFLGAHLNILRRRRRAAR
jgi:hypothetical protein